MFGKGLRCFSSPEFFLHRNKQNAGSQSPHMAARVDRQPKSGDVTELKAAARGEEKTA
jgi:hypothetical protein